MGWDSARAMGMAGSILLATILRRASLTGRKKRQTAQTAPVANYDRHSAIPPARFTIPDQRCAAGPKFRGASDLANAIVSLAAGRR